MCGAAVIAPVAALATSLFGGSKGGGTQSYTPQEIEMTPNIPDPTPAEPTLGIDNSDASASKAKQGKSALVIKRNPGVSVPGGGGSGVNVAGR